MSRNVIIVLSLLSIILCCVVLCDIYAANEIKADVEVIVNKGELKVSQSSGNYNIDMSGDAISDIVQTFTTDATGIVNIAAGVATNGVAYFQNLTTNATWYIDIGITNGANFFVFARVKAAERWCIRLHPTNTISGHAVGGSVNLRTLVIED